MQSPKKLYMYNLPSLLNLYTFIVYYFAWKDIYLTLHSFTEFQSGFRFILFLW